MTLQITVREAQLNPTGMLVASPYVSLRVGSSAQKTPPSSGTNPRWQTSLAFKARDSTMKVEVWSTSATSDELIGEGHLNLTKYYSAPGSSQSEYVDLLRNGTIVGRVMMAVVYDGPPVNPGATVQPYLKQNPYISSQSPIILAEGPTHSAVGARMITSTMVRANSPVSLQALPERPVSPVRQIPPAYTNNVGASTVNYPSIANNLYQNNFPPQQPTKFQPSAIPRTSSYSNLYPVGNVPTPTPNQYPAVNNNMPNYNNINRNEPPQGYNGYNPNQYSMNQYQQQLNPIQMNNINNIIGNRMANNLGPQPPVLPPGFDPLGLGLALSQTVMQNEWDPNFKGRY